jgi:hypothetical protein
MDGREIESQSTGGKIDCRDAQHHDWQLAPACDVLSDCYRNVRLARAG